MALPDSVAMQMRKLQQRWPSSGYGVLHTSRFLPSHELRRCVGPSCPEFLSWSAVCRVCSTPTQPLWR